MPMVVELVVAMLACVRIGAVHSIVFAGFSAESLCERIVDSQCCLLITADGFYRGDKLINLKLLADEALQKCRDKGFPVGRCIMLKHLSKEPEGILGSQSPPAKRPCPDLQQEKQAGRVKKTRPVPKVFSQLTLDNLFASTLCFRGSFTLRRICRICCGAKTINVRRAKASSLTERLEAFSRPFKSSEKI